MKYTRVVRTNDNIFEKGDNRASIFENQSSENKAVMYYLATDT